MNDFFDKLGAAAKRVAGNVATEVDVAAEEQKVKECYQALGKLYYQATIRGEEPAGMAFADQCRKIDASLKRIRELKNRKTVSTDEFVEVD